MQTYIRKEGKEAVITDPDNFRFLRFNSVFIVYTSEEGSQSIDEKLQLLQNQLQLFMKAFSDLGEITLSATINQNDQSQFHDHTHLLDYFRERLIPICDSSSVYNYNFLVYGQSDNDGAADFIAQILQMRPIIRCREVLFRYSNETFIQLPVGVIANWLHRNFDGEVGGAGTSKMELTLSMNNRIKILNAMEMCDHIKTVRAFFNFLNILKIV